VARDKVDSSSSYNLPASKHVPHQPTGLHALFAQDLFELYNDRQVLYAADHSEHWPNQDEALPNDQDFR